MKFSTLFVITKNKKQAKADNRAMIRVNAIPPLERAAFPGSDEDFTKYASLGVPVQRVAKPEEIADVVCF